MSLFSLVADNMNAIFEVGGALMILDHIRIIRKDKEVKGVSILASAWFWLWGFFNIFYYSHLNQTFSWYAGFAVLTANSIYMYHILYYKGLLRKLPLFLSGKK